MGEKRAARPRRVTKSESLDRLVRLKQDFAVLPFGALNSQFKNLTISGKQKNYIQESESDGPRIRSDNTKVGGVAFAAKEIAKVISGMIREEDR